MKIKQKWCESCQEYHPLTEEYFYKMKLSPNGFSKICKEAYKKRYCDYRRLRKKLEEENKPIEKSQVPILPEPIIYKYTLSRWNRDQLLMITLRCRNCGKIHEIHKMKYILNCECGKNLLIWWSINFLWSSILFKNYRLRTYSVKSYDRWR